MKRSTILVSSKQILDTIDFKITNALKRMKNILSILVIVLAVNAAQAQKTKAEKIYDSKGYAAYLELQNKEDLSKMDRKTIIRMANSSRKTGDSRGAENARACRTEAASGWAPASQTTSPSH